MKIAETVPEVHELLKKSSISPAGFVPTMGALHKGHLSLVSKAVSECPTVTVSIFVNPNQFNDKEDLRNYPRNIEKDTRMLSSVLRENDLVFIPPVSEIYPAEDKRVFSFGTLDRVMEGSHRPGHFNGVAQVVSRLFDIVNPDIAYFGQKDFQQLTIIRELVRQLNYNIKISSCPIVREADGLAMSSRNQLLDPAIRLNAGVIYRTISEASAMANAEEPDKIRKYVFEKIDSVPHFTAEYFEIVDDVELKPLSDRKEYRSDRKYFGCIAVRAGKIRLIDNIEIPLL
jgi:pantoate--beta-alanine ligase